MNPAKTMTLSLKNVYQLLISEMRYGYGRNNHLMPSCGYDKVQAIIPQMYEVDKEYAVYTMKQLCEECISNQLVMNFYDGEDDEHGNRKEAIEFVTWALNWVHDKGEPDWKPYNYDRFEENLRRDDEPRYLIYELVGANKEKKLITPEPVSQNRYLDVVLEGVPHDISCTYRLERHKVSDKFSDRRNNYTYHILSPFEKDFYVEHI